MINWKKAARRDMALIGCSCALMTGCQSIIAEDTGSSTLVNNETALTNDEPSSETVLASQESSVVPSETSDTSTTSNTVTEEPIIFAPLEAAPNQSELLQPPTLEVAANNPDGYLINFDTIFDLALNHSKEYLALNKEVESQELLKEKEEKYYYPTLTFDSESTKYYGGAAPDPDYTQEYIFTIDSKLYGSAVKDKITASKHSLDAGLISLRAQEISIYYTVLKYLTKIELTREYEKAAEEYRKEIEVYYLKQVNSSNEGVSTQTDAMEAKLSVAEFDESVYSVVSNIEQYFRKLSEETGVDLELDANSTEDNIGIEYDKLQPFLGADVEDVTPEKLLESNADLMQTQKRLASSLSMARASRERFTVELTSENYVFSDEGNSSSDDDDDSYVQLNLQLDLFNQGLQADQDSAFKIYEAEKLRFDKQFKQAMDQFKSNLTNYNQQKIKREKTAHQIEILTELIENQKEEIYTDKVTYKDIVDSIDKLNRAQQTLLDIDLSLFDTLYELETLKSEKIL